MQTASRRDDEHSDNQEQTVTNEADQRVLCRLPPQGSAHFDHSGPAGAAYAP